MNVLITSVSRKVWLVEAFRRALSRYGGGRVIACDADPVSAALYRSDGHYRVPLSVQSNFIDEIMAICKKEKIKLIVPTRDRELLIFAENKEYFAKAGIIVMVSAPEVIKICSDKYRFYQFFQDSGIDVAATWLEDLNASHARFPLFVKSRYGAGGAGAFKAENPGQLRAFIEYCPDALTQEFIAGPEYTVDLFSDFSPRVISVVVRRRLEVVAGESYKAKTVNAADIVRLSIKAAEKLKSQGHITLQFIKNERQLKLIEINPRFGGGAALGFAAGCDSPSFLIELARGGKLTPRAGQFEEGLLMLRYTHDLFMRRGKVV